MPIKLIMAFRTATGWRSRPSGARLIESSWNPLEIADLPLAIREDMKSRMDDAEACGFRNIGILKANTIGSWVQYTCNCLDRDGTVALAISAIRIQVNQDLKSSWTMGLRTYCQDGTLYMTGNSPHIPSFMMDDSQRLKNYPDPMSITELLRRHNEHLGTLSLDRIVKMPREEAIPFMIARGRQDFQKMIDRGLIRKLTEKEVERLRKIDFDF